MEATKTRATISAKHRTNNAATQYTIRASRKIIGSIWSPCEIWNNGHSDEYQITVNVAPGYVLKSYAPTMEEALAEFDRLTDGKYNIDAKGIAATPAETPQISTGTAETVNVSAEGTKSVSEAENNPMCETTCEERPTLDDHDYYTWLWMRDYEAAIGAPQSPETPQTAECTADTPEARETARKRQNRAIGSRRATRRDTLRDTLHSVTFAPRECSTVEAVYW